MNLTYITGNPNKAKIMAAYFNMPIGHRKLELDEIQSLDPEEIAGHKALEAYRLVGSPVLIEDVSMVFHALGGLPGPLIKWFEHSLGNEGLCRILDGYDDRLATASVIYALYDGTEMHFFKGSVNGSISQQPQGPDLFGFDQVFIPEGHERTWAEMTPDEKHETAMRKSAMADLAAYLKTQS